MPIAKNIQYLRKQANMTQKDLAVALGYKAAETVRKWEGRQTNPPMSKVREMSELFHREFSEICDLDLEKVDIKAKGEQPTQEEMQMLLKFRALPDSSKHLIRAAINAGYEHVLNGEK